jgi:hypothetical protein
VLFSELCPESDKGGYQSPNPTQDGNDKWGIESCGSFSSHWLPNIKGKSNPEKEDDESAGPVTN